jgi:hypothetical protein
LINSNWFKPYQSILSKLVNELKFLLFAKNFSFKILLKFFCEKLNKLIIANIENNIKCSPFINLDALM